MMYRCCCCNRGVEVSNDAGTREKAMVVDTWYVEHTCETHHRLGYEIVVSTPQAPVNIPRWN